MRRLVGEELGKRFQAGEKDIVPRLVKLLDNDSPLRPVDTKTPPTMTDAGPVAPYMPVAKN